MRHRFTFAFTAALLAVVGLAHTSAQTGSGIATLAWPTAFTTETPDPMDQVYWHEEIARADGLEVRLPYPEGWTVERSSQGSLLIARSADGSRFLTVSQPLPAPFRMDEPMPDDRLEETTRELAGAANDGSLTLLSSGQMRAPSGNLWTWFEVQLASDGLPSELSLIERMNFEGSREWTFATTTGGRFVTMQCSALMPRGASDADQHQRLLDSGRECGAMLRRLSVRPS
jgi:hypothetical protein